MRKGGRFAIRRFDPELRFLLKLDPALESWRALAAQWWASLERRSQYGAIQSALTHFLVYYIYGHGLYKLPPTDLFATGKPLPNLDATMGLAKLSEKESKKKHDTVSDFVEWVLRTKLAEPDASSHRVVPAHLSNPFPRRQVKRRKKLVYRIDPEFRFLLKIDPALEIWRAWVVEWRATLKNQRMDLWSALTHFLGYYLCDHGLHKLPPAEIFATGKPLPNLDTAMGLAEFGEKSSRRKHDYVSDFLEWVLRTKLAEPDASGHRVVPAHLSNPFPRKQGRISGKTSDLTFAHVLDLDPQLDGWRQLAAEWLQQQKVNVSPRRDALDRFLVVYIHGRDLERNPVKFLLRETSKPGFADAKTLGLLDIRLNNHIADFLDWVLKEKLCDDETREWDRSRFHNPVERLSSSGLQTATESNKSALSIRYIKELREILAGGRHFRDWAWAQQAMDGGKTGGDWYVVDEKVINRSDPDCVWRERDATYNEKRKKGYPARVFEMWSPVRAMAMYIKLELPLRVFQIRMLDSGEADTWRYVYGPLGGSFTRNDSPLATGDEKRPCQRGVFHRSLHEAGAGLFINTNKTADIGKAENKKGYVIPWAHDKVLYWLEKLRNWQERYNPLKEPTRWVDLEMKHFGRIPPHPEVLEQRGTACFLFRDPTRIEGCKPLYDGALDYIWYLLLAKLETMCLARGETLDDGTPLRFVAPNGKGTYFPPHALRVSLISYLILDLNLPVAVVSKLISGHARIIMTLYYTKFGKAYMREVMAEAEKREQEADQANHRRFLMDATFEQIGQRFASMSEDAARAVTQNRSAASFVFEDKGICPVGGTMCDVGGKMIFNRGDAGMVYAPVPGYPQERNCVRCRLFLTGPAFLPGLVAHFNALSLRVHNMSRRYNIMEEEMQALERHRFMCELKAIPFIKVKELEKLTHRVEAEAESLGKLVNDMQATFYLAERSLEIARSMDKEGVQLVAMGSLSDLQTALIEAKSELHQLEVICENAVIYPEMDASFAAMRRAQVLDCMLLYNDMEPFFMHLMPEQQLLSGNAVMKLIAARTGSIKNSLDYAECRLKLKDLGLLEEVRNEIAQVAATTPAKVLIDHARTNRELELY